jgi:hypothetical protein
LRVSLKQIGQRFSLKQFLAAGELPLEFSPHIEIASVDSFQCEMTSSFWLCLSKLRYRSQLRRMRLAFMFA